jgi:hypothetical protein
MEYTLLNSAELPSYLDSGCLLKSFREWLFNEQ